MICIHLFAPFSVCFIFFIHTWSNNNVVNLLARGFPVRIIFALNNKLNLLQTSISVTQSAYWIHKLYFVYIRLENLIGLLHISLSTAQTWKTDLCSENIRDENIQRANHFCSEIVMNVFTHCSFCLFEIILFFYHSYGSFCACLLAASHFIFPVVVTPKTV